MTDDEIIDANYAGYQRAREELKALLADALRVHGTAAGVSPGAPDHDGELLSDSMARSIFVAVFGVVASDEAFGPDEPFDISELTG